MLTPVMTIVVGKPTRESVVAQAGPDRAGLFRVAGG
jgi:hypothetical protein